VKLNAALEVMRIKRQKLSCCIPWTGNSFCLRGERKIGRPAKHDLQLFAPICQATFTLNYATTVHIPVYVATMAHSICSSCAFRDYALAPYDHLISKHSHMYMRYDSLKLTLFLQQKLKLVFWIRGDEEKSILLVKPSIVTSE
jgi:hypothetical protein